MSRAGRAADSEPIPMVDLGAEHRALEADLLEAFRDVIASGRFVLGDPVERFEAELAQLCDVRRAVSCNSGTDALWLALRALDIGPGDAVLCPAFSFVATASTIARVGARPVFVDLDPATFNLDPEDALRRLEREPGVRAVMSVDLFGRLCELGPLEAACRERGIPIIEDAAQSIGALDSTGARPGQRVRVACLSFYPTKNLGALGDGGGLVSSDPELARRAAGLRMHGERAPGVYAEIGINSRLDALQATALSLKLRRLEGVTKARLERALHYDTLFAARGALPADEPAEAAALPLRTPTPVVSPARHTHHRYVVRVGAGLRDRVVERLRAQAIACEVYYPRGLHQQPALAHFFDAEREAPLAETERAAREALALPLYPELGLDQVERVVDRVVAALTEEPPPSPFAQ